MTIRSLNTFITERRLNKTLPLSVLRNATLGIDVDHYIKRALGAQNRREPLVHALGGFPFSIESIIDSDLAVFKANGITPLFVFKGLSVSTVDRPFSEPDLRARKLAYAWDLYDKGKGEQAVIQFDESDTFDVTNSFQSRQLINLLISKGVEYTVAPYTSLAQLAYLSNHPESYIDAIYGPSEVLLFSADKVITSIDWKNSSFQWINRKQLIAELGFNPEQFIEAVIAVGCSVSPTPFPAVGQQHMASPLKVIQELLMTYPTVYAAVLSFPDTNSLDNRSPRYVERFQKALMAVTFQPVMKENGRVEPITDGGDYPNDVHEFIGQRLPDEYFFYLCNGLIGADILNAITSGTLVEKAPLDGGENVQYRRFIVQLEELRSKILSLIIQPLHRYFHFKQIKGVYWFDATIEHTFPKVTPPTYHSVSNWRTTTELLDRAENVPSSPRLADLTNVLNTASNEWIESTIFKYSPVKPSIPLSSDREIISTTIFRVLSVLGYVESSHKLSKWGQVLVKGLNVSGQKGLEDALVVVLSLIRSGAVAITDSDVKSDKNASAEASSATASHSLLVSRIASHIQLRHHPVGFTGPLSRTVLRFHSFINAQTVSLRWLIEATLVSLLANGDADRISRVERDQWHSLVAKLPFSTVPNAGTGIAVKSYLDELAGKSVTSKEAVQSVSSMFKQAINVEEDITSAFKFWDGVIASVEQAEQLGLLTSDVCKPFRDANDWLKTKRLQ